MDVISEKTRVIGHQWCPLQDKDKQNENQVDEAHESCRLQAN